VIVLATKTGGFVLTLHQGFANAVLIYSLLLAAWGLFLYFRSRNPPGSYLGALAILEGLAIIQGLVGIILLGQGHRPHDALHFLYGVVAVVTLPTAYFMSTGGMERRDSLVFGLATLFLVGIAIRGITTGGT
jgi:hypothetical protein